MMVSFLLIKSYNQRNRLWYLIFMHGCFFYPDGEISISKFELNAFDYHIVGTDLRDINQVMILIDYTN